MFRKASGLTDSGKYSGRWSHQRSSRPTKRASGGGEHGHYGGEHGLFIDLEEMKRKIKMNITRKKYNVMDSYHQTGVAQYIAKHPCFEQVTLAVIALNALWIAIDTDYNNSEVLHEAHPVFQVAENSFCILFLLEWLIRFFAFKNKIDGIRDGWFVFDGALVFLMMLETWVMTIVLLATGAESASASMGNASILKVARLVRLTRMARMARLLRAVPELMILIKGMVAATRSVFFTLCLLVSIIYVFGIGFVQLTKGLPLGEKYFETVALSMFTLLLRGTYLDEITEIMDDMREESVWFCIIFLMFVLLAAQTVMNMLIGVLCEVVSIVAATEKEEMMMNYVVARLGEILSQLNYSTDDHISKKEFVKMLGNVDATKTLQEVGVDAVGLVDFADVIFAADDHTDNEVDLTFQEFMDIVLQFRGTNTATVKDVVESQKIVRNGIKSVSQQLQKLEEKLGNERGIKVHRQDQMNDMEAVATILSRQSLPDAAQEVGGERSKSVIRDSERRASTSSVGSRKPSLKGKKSTIEGNLANSTEGRDSTSYKGVSDTDFLDTLSSQMAAINRCVSQGHATMHRFVSQQLEQEGQLRQSAEREVTKLQKQTASLTEENRQLRDLLGTVQPRSPYTVFSDEKMLNVHSPSRRILTPTRDAELSLQPSEAESRMSHGKLMVQSGPSIHSPAHLRGARDVEKVMGTGSTAKAFSAGGSWRPTSANPFRREGSGSGLARPNSASSEQSAHSLGGRSVDDPGDDRLEFFLTPIDRVPGGMPSPSTPALSSGDGEREGERDNLLSLRATAFPPEQSSIETSSPLPPQTASPTLNLDPSAREQQRHTLA